VTVTSVCSNFCVRRILKWIHIWGGLAAGLFIALVCLTGSVIVFRTELELALSPKGDNRAPTVGLNEIERRVGYARPNAQIRRVRFPAGAGDPFIVQIDSNGKQQSIICEASTGRVVGSLNTGFVSWLIDLHRNLLVGKTGRKAVGVVGTILLTLAITGMLLWVVGTGKWKSWISIRPQGSSRRFNFELHRAGGLWSFALLSVLAFTGVGLSYPDTFRGVLQQIIPGPPPAKAPRVSKGADATLLSLSEYLRIGMGAMPDARPTELRLPEKDKSPVDLRLHRAGDLSPDGNHVYLEGATGKVLAVSILARQPVTTRIFSAFSPLHYAEFGGLAIKAIWALAGLMPSILLVTGFLTWWRPSKRKKRLAIEQDAPELLTARSTQL
jgi:uncharacterized iron-regulated membrane protein